jgi:hypothetical protein
MHEPADVAVPRLLSPAGLTVAAVIVAATLFTAIPSTATGGALWAALDVVMTALPPALGWMAAALGFGRLLLMRTRFANRFTLLLPVGVATLMWLDNVFGRLGPLTNPIVAWLVLIVGWAIFLQYVVRAILQARDHGLKIRWPMTSAALLPAVVVIALAACSAPGVLWLTEFAGYDALAYHLQLPKEWLALGAITPVEHNVYSALPSGVEGAYLHLGVLMNGVAAAGPACQWLHVLMTFGVAIMLGRLTRSILGAPFGVLAAGLFLATPWTIIVGSLAYNEMAALLMLMGMIALLDELAESPICTTSLIAWLAAASMMSKMSSVGLIVLPICTCLAWALIRGHRRSLAGAMAAGIGTGLIGLAPWLVGNAMVLGQPVFPFGTSLFGSAHWTAEQVANWNAGHVGGLSIGERMSAAWHQLFWYGIGPAPSTEPWRAQWTILPWLAIAAGCVAGGLSRHRAWTIRPIVILLLQFAFWLFMTHVKSRFMIPAGPVACLLIAIACEAIVSRLRARAQTSRTRPNTGTIIVMVVILIWSAMPIAIFRHEGARNGAADPLRGVGMTKVFSGDAGADPEQRAIARTRLPSAYINEVFTDDEHVLLIGHAAPLYMRNDRVTYTTVWDRGPMSRLLNSQVRRNSPLRDEDIRAALLGDGFTHALVQYPMLARWHSSGWSDASLEPARLRVLFDAIAQPVVAYDEGSVLYAIRR